ncbi:MAG: GNAT family N-acetyltransferase [Lachnospiraceae bacterium]|nr:GNAT family N-acetyltransferase [Lachnospiraceae bacterium]
MRVIRRIKEKEWGDAMKLVWSVFLAFNAEGYTPEGVDNFYKFITDDVLYMMFKQGEYVVFGCFDDDEIIGVISVRGKNHISLLFVDGEYHHQGIAKRLVRELCNYLIEEGGQFYTTVNSSPYAVDFYHKVGFKDTGKTQKANGIIYTPMRFWL